MTLRNRITSALLPVIMLLSFISFQPTYAQSWSPLTLNSQQYDASREADGIYHIKIKWPKYHYQVLNFDFDFDTFLQLRLLTLTRIIKNSEVKYYNISQYLVAYNFKNLHPVLYETLNS